MSEYLCHDFKSPRVDASRRLPATFRFVPIAFYVALVGAAYFITMDVLALRKADQDRLVSEELLAEKEQAKSRFDAEKHAIDVEKAKAEHLAKWVEGTRVLQPLCVETARAIRGEVRIAEMSLDRNSQLPAQIDISLRLTGADSSHIAAVENALGKLSYRSYSPQQARSKDVIDYQSTLVFVND
jgi:hypothetical protein